MKKPNEPVIQYDLVRTDRKTVALYVRPDGRIEVRAPLRASKTYIDGFVKSKQDWIGKNTARLIQRKSARKVIKLTADEEIQYRKKAKEYFTLKCIYFAALMGVRHGMVKINGAKTRWGSCNRKGDINFTYRLLFAPEDVIDYVVVHELAHTKEMNHSNNFWSVVAQTMPDYQERRKRLREFERQVELIII